MSRENKAKLNINFAAQQLIGELENVTYDYPEDTDDYKRADALLSNHQALVEELYNWSTTSVYGEGMCCFDDRVVAHYLKDIRFLGKEKLMQMCDAQIKAEGY